MRPLSDGKKEQLKEIVNSLVKARQEQSLTIEEIAVKTLIRPALLQALEEGQFEELPELIFVRGFIILYGDALGLNGNSLAEQFMEISEQSQIKQERPQVKKKMDIYIPIFLPYVVLVSFASLVLFYILDLSKKTVKISHDYSNNQVNQNTQKPINLS